MIWIEKYVFLIIIPLLRVSMCYQIKRCSNDLRKMKRLKTFNNSKRCWVDSRLIEFWWARNVVVPSAEQEWPACTPLAIKVHLYKNVCLDRVLKWRNMPMFKRTSKTILSVLDNTCGFPRSFVLGTSMKFSSVFINNDMVFFSKALWILATKRFYYQT